MVGLVAERNSWRKRFAAGHRPPYLVMYEAEWGSELWRDARNLEKLAEYALWLEAQLAAKKRRRGTPC